mmetsp:Transcript_8650/g.21694  ORF Transcript_8650/g.21694 Transcript_8650/m.21694 type:complete len:707 (+) Transcript_8650:194-2314(+)
MKTASASSSSRASKLLPALIIFTTVLRVSWFVMIVDGNDFNHDDSKPLCTLYMAPSTIPNAGFGMFAGHKSFTKDEFIADPDIVVPVYDMLWNNGILLPHQYQEQLECDSDSDSDDGDDYEDNDGDNQEKPKKKRQFHFLWDEYSWTASNFIGMKEEIEDISQLKAISPGIGSVANSHLPLVNIVDDHNSRRVVSSSSPRQHQRSGVVDDGGFVDVDVDVDPGAGASTIYHGRRFKATSDIPPGMELYVSYGSEYFRSRSVYNRVALPANYRSMDKLITQFFVRMRSVCDIRRLSSPDLEIKSMFQDLWKDVVRNIATVWDGHSRTMNALPETNDIDNLEWILDNGGTGLVHRNNSVRRLDWLEQHGRCMDKITDGVSSIPSAGRGAFAKHSIKEGELVAPVPLIHVQEKTYTIFEGKVAIKKCQRHDNNQTHHYVNVADQSKPVHHQLLLNYCFGHRESSILLCPYGHLTSLVNHDGMDPNTKVVWAKDSEMTHPEWRRKPIQEWAYEETAGLSFNYVALRDIEEREEITIDYGSEWSKAWSDHRRRRRRSRASYVPAAELNERFDIPAVRDQRYSMDHSNHGVFMYCRLEFLEWSGIDDLVQNTSQKQLLDWSGHEIRRCRIRQKNEDERYLTEVVDRLDDGHNMTTEFIVAVAFAFPREALYFEDIPYQRDHHQRWSFRHDMRISDDLFPKAWKDKIFTSRDL